MTKNVLIIVASVLLLLLVTFLGGNEYLERAVRDILPRLTKEAARFNLELSETSFQDASISSSRSLTWRYIRSKVRVLNPELFDSKTRYTISIGQLRLFAKDHSYEELVIDAQEILLGSRDRQAGDLSANQSEIDQLANVSLYGRMFSTEFATSPSNPGEGLKARLEALGGFFADGYVTVPIEFSGDVQVRLGNRTVKLEVRLVEDAGRWKIELPVEALEQLSSTMGVSVSEPEVALLIPHPLRTAIWAQTRFFVDSKIKDLPPRQGKEEVPIETYRHVLLGYYLSQTLGQEFFQRYLEAYIAGGASLRSAKELQSEKENLQLGRRYAEENTPPAKLLELAVKEGSVASKRENWSMR